MLQFEYYRGHCVGTNLKYKRKRGKNCVNITEITLELLKRHINEIKENIWLDSDFYVYLCEESQASFSYFCL